MRKAFCVCLFFCCCTYFTNCSDLPLWAFMGTTHLQYKICSLSNSGSSVMQKQLPCSIEGKVHPCQAEDITDHTVDSGKQWASAQTLLDNYMNKSCQIFCVCIHYYVCSFKYTELKRSAFFAVPLLCPLHPVALFSSLTCIKNWCNTEYMACFFLVYVLKLSQFRVKLLEFDWNQTETCLIRCFWSDKSWPSCEVSPWFGFITKQNCIHGHKTINRYQHKSLLYCKGCFFFLMVVPPLWQGFVALLYMLHIALLNCCAS